ncbi:MAG TPA: Asp-tRNA(Asn)/Glu-tRNA(Gln) amidotransferase subunit GatC [Burkholderiales bacterium]|nr:Asp-tRNA(Asn)/Glu-tRNA(Gln) amidotransferase subunit GatC [Burkholderiales bacterium]
MAEQSRSLSLNDVKRIAYLARIAIDDQEAAAVLKQLSGIFALIGQMQAVDTTGVEPMSHAQDVVLRLRDDKVTERDQHELFQSVAPQAESGLYLVPKVIE